MDKEKTPKCYGCKYLRQAGWDYFCVKEGFKIERRIDTKDYVFIIKTPIWCLLNKRRINKMNKQLTDKQLELVLPTIDNKRMDFEKDNFRAGYIQAMLNYGIISGKQYETILETEAIAPFYTKK